MFIRALYRPSHIARLMSSTAYIVPVDHKTPSTQLPNLDPLKLWSTTPTGEKAPKVGTTRIFYNTPSSPEGPNANITALSSLGDGFSTKQGNTRREIVRKAVGNAVKDVKSLGESVKYASVDASADPHAAGEVSSTCYCHQSQFNSLQLSPRTWPCTSFRSRPLLRLSLTQT